MKHFRKTGKLCNLLPHSGIKHPVTYSSLGDVNISKKNCKCVMEIVRKVNGIFFIHRYIVYKVLFGAVVCVGGGEQ